jgi:transposase
LAPVDAEAEHGLDFSVFLFSLRQLYCLDLKIIEFSDQGKGVAEIGRLLGLHAQTVRKIIKKFQANGFEGLQRKPRGKPEEKLKAYRKPYWEDILSQPPSSFEKLDTPDQNWSYELIQTYIAEYLALNVSISTIWNQRLKNHYLDFCGGKYGAIMVLCLLFSELLLIPMSFLKV